MSKILEVFSEFISLSYNSSAKINTRLEKDIPISEYIIARYKKTGVEFHYLYCGASFSIPDPWGNIFSAFNVYLGDRVNYLGVENFKELGDIEKTIYLMTKLFIFLDRSLNNNSGQELLNILGKLSDIDTGSFRLWMLEKYELRIEALEFNTVNGNIKI